MEDQLTCIHRSHGLCESCGRDYEADPSAWEEFGDHPDGLRRRAAEEALVAAWEEERRREPPPEPMADDVPF